jgi:D-threo-aldose 1-dehydrogenase
MILNQRRRVGTTDLELPLLGLGTCPLGGVYSEIDEASSRATFEASWEAGIRFYDTAPWYGLGQAEHRTGRTLYNRNRSDYFLTTKVGRVLRAPKNRATYSPPAWNAPLKFEVQHEFTYDAIMRSYEDSLQRLGINQVDALYIHDLDTGYYPLEEDINAKFKELDDGGYRALQELKSSGEVKAIGAGINERGMITRFLEGADLDVFLVASRYTLLEHEIYNDEIIKVGERGGSIVIGGAFNSGILATGVKEGAKYEYGSAPAHVIKRVQKLSDVAESHDVPLAAAALQFPLAAPQVCSVIFGAVNATEVVNNIEHLNRKIPHEFWSDLRGENLIPDTVPVPLE